MKKKRNRNVIITGATQGLGFELAKKFVKLGYDICICSRNLKELKRIKNFLRNHIKNEKQKIIISKTDVSSERQVKNLIQNAKNEFKVIDVIINNAGVLGPKGNFEDLNLRKWDMAFSINFYGSLYVFKHILKIFKKQKFGKIIQISGGGATSPYPFISSYAASKAAIVRFAETLSHEVKDFKIDINSVAPGFLPTRLHDEVLKAGPKKVGNNLFKKTVSQLKNCEDSFKKPVELCEFLASNSSNGITGKLIAAYWDNWGKFKKNLINLKKSDVFTLRRIIGKDRGLSYLDK